MTRIHVHIERLAMHGLDEADAHAVAAALRGEVARALRAGGAARIVPARGESAATPAPPIAHGAAPARTGRGVAGAIAAAIAARVPARGTR